MADQYKALTRKYRPKNFEDIVSQEHVSSTLKNAIEQNRLNHAYLFCGPRGVGKTTMARVLARTINEVDETVDGEALNNTLNIIEIDAASNNKVEDVHALRERIRIKPQSGRYKVYIIDEVHMLTKQAFNALLKTLEEPPEHVIFIFATTEPHKVLPTILSRCQRFDFRRIRVEEIVARLEAICKTENITIDNESLHVIAKKADGSLRDALGIMDQTIAFCGNDIKQKEMFSALNVVSTDHMFVLMDAVEKKDANAGLALINDLLQEGYDIQEFLSTLTEHLRNLYLARDTRNVYLIEASEETKSRYQDAATIFDTDDLMRMLHIINDVQFKIREARQPRIHFEIAILKLIHMERMGGLRQLINELQELKKIQSEEPKKPDITPSAKSPSSSSAKTNPEEDISSQQSTTKPTNTNSSNSPAPSVDQEQTNDEVSLFGKPSLKRPNSKLSKVNKEPGEKYESSNEVDEVYNGSISGNLALAPKAKPENHYLPKDESVSGSVSEAGKPFYLHHAKEVWDKYLEGIYEKMDKVLYFTLQRVKPVELKDGILFLECQDAFTNETIEENKRIFSNAFNKITGQKLRFQPVLKQTIESGETLDPYRHFKELQKKDPILRTIVELFGAELEY
ncbi:MAG: DNA polymerase III subunit gamma/tau [Balneolales bacterium]